MTELYEKGSKYCSICSARSALAAVVKIDSYSSISDHPLLSQFVEGVYNLHPPFPRYTHTWDSNKVLTYIVNMPDNSELTFKQLTQKLVILLLLLGGKRIDTIHMFNSDYMVFSESCCVFYPSGF